MTMIALRQPIAPGELAPYFVLPGVDRPGTVSLDDYRGRSPLFLTLLLGLWCPFCRRQIVQIGAIEGKLKELGVETLAVVATAADNAKLYFRFRPTRLRLASDPELTTHRAYGVPKPVPTPAMMEAMDTIRVDPFGEFPEPLPIAEAARVLQEKDGYAVTPTDQADGERQWPQLKGQFLIDQNGIVRWAEIECGREGLAGIGKFPSEESILGAARGLVG